MVEQRKLRSTSVWALSTTSSFFSYETSQNIWGRGRRGSAGQGAVQPTAASLEARTASEFVRTLPTYMYFGHYRHILAPSIASPSSCPMYICILSLSAPSSLFPSGILKFWLVQRIKYKFKIAALREYLIYRMWAQPIRPVLSHPLLYA